MSEALEALFLGVLLGGIVVWLWEVVMPYKSQKQERYLRSQKPAVAAQFDAHAETPDDGSKFETESHVYNHRSRNNLKQNQRKPRGAAAY